MSNTVKNIPKIFYGWWIVVASSLMTTYNAGTMFYGFTAFFTPIVSEFGWSRAATSLAFSLQRLEGGIAAPIFGYLIDKLGPRKLNLFAVTIFGVGFLLLSRINSLLSFYVAFLIISIGHSAGFFSVGAATVANWFIRKRGKAMGFLTGGVCLAGTLVPVLVWVIRLCGWRWALVIAGIGMWVVGIPLSFVLRQRPEQYGLLPDGDNPQKYSSDQSTRNSPTVHPQVVSTEIEFTAREAIKTSTFWLLSIGSSISFMAMSALFVHVMPFLESVGISRERAGFVVTFIIFLSVMGRIGLGWLSDYMDKRYVLSIAIGLQVVGLIIFSNIQTLWHVIPFLITFSPGYGALIPLRPAIQGEYFGRKHFATIQGFYMSVSTVSSMIGPPFAGWVWDMTGSYRLAFLILSGITALAIPLILAVSPPRRRATEY
jgi:MFS family permease